MSELILAEEVPGQGPALRPRATRYPGGRVFLRPLDPEADVDGLYAASHGTPQAASLWTYMGYGPFPERQSMLEWLRARAAASDPLFLTVCDARTGARLGMTSFLAIDTTMRRLELGHIWYAPEAQGTGVNREAVYLMLCEAFDRCGYRRVEWKCDRLNERSRRAALRLGFTFEGVFRQHMIVKGRNRDTAWYSVLDREWPGVKGRLERELRAGRAEPESDAGLPSDRGRRHEPWFERKFSFGFPVGLHPSLRSRLRGAPARLEESLSGLERERLTFRPGDKWSIQENAGHLADLEPLWQVRLDAFLEAADTLPAADLTNRKTHEAAHNERPTSEILATFRQARLHWIDRLERLSPADFERTSLHPRLEVRMRLVDHLLFIAEHDDHHLARIWELAAGPEEE